MFTKKVTKSFLTLLVSCLVHLYTDWLEFFDVPRQHYKLGNIILICPDYRCALGISKYLFASHRAAAFTVFASFFTDLLMSLSDNSTLVLFNLIL